MSGRGTADEIAALGPWFHNLHLPDGSQTAPDHSLGDFPSFKWTALAPYLPADLSGWTALDVGCNAGFYSFELARRGARVTGLDVDRHYLRQAHWAAERMGLTDRVEFTRAQVYDLGRSDEQWDLVLFMGVFYHLRYPLLGLDAVRRCVRRRLIFQALSMPGAAEPAKATRNLDLDERHRLTRDDWPKMAFIEHALAGDRTNWWVPNPAAMRAMLRSTGLRIVASPMEETYLCEPSPKGSFWSWDATEFRAAIGRGDEP